LTSWHELNDGDNALFQVAALECALADGAVITLGFGIGIGSLGLLFARHRIETTLADVNPRLNDYARWRFDRRGLLVDIVDLRHQALPETRFELISGIDVFEHLPEPAATVTSLAQALRPGGTILVHFPLRATGNRGLIRRRVGNRHRKTSRIHATFGLTRSEHPLAPQPYCRSLLVPNPPTLCTCGRVTMSW